jgi:hypothetical protein
LSFPGPPPTNYTLSFLISKKSLKIDGGYCTYDLFILVVKMLHF